jgi:hypothetical protein
MSDYEPATGGREASGWTTGGVVFAGCIMVMIGIFGALQGLAAIIKDNFFVIAPNYAYKVDVTTWGWIHLIVGIVVALAGFYVFTGSLWARVIGIIVATLSAIANFLWIPYFPFWAILIIALDVFVIWALASYGREASG